MPEARTARTARKRGNVQGAPKRVDQSLGLRERNKQDKLLRIQAAARTLFEEQGYDSTTIREIARRADVGVGTVFLYAKDKTELLFLIFRDELHRVFDTASASVKAHAPVIDQLMAYFTPIIEALAPSGALARIMVREAFRLSGDAARDMTALRSKINGHLKHIIVTAQRNGELREDLSDRELVDAIWANFRFYVDDWLGTGDQQVRNGARRLRAGLVILLRGIGTQRR
jgi:AcrR family transcriptional regulator